MDYYARKLEKYNNFREAVEKKSHLDGAQAFWTGSKPVQQVKNGARALETRKSRRLPHNSGQHQ